MLVGSMMMPDPIMLTVTMKVSWIRLIRFGWFMMPSPVPSCAASVLGQAIHQVSAATGGLLESQAVDVGLEAGELLIEFPGVQQVVLDRLGGLGEALARHDCGNAGRIRDHHD